MSSMYSFIYNGISHAPNNKERRRSQTLCKWSVRGRLVRGAVPVLSAVVLFHALGELPMRLVFSVIVAVTLSAGGIRSSAVNFFHFSVCEHDASKEKVCSARDSIMNKTYSIFRKNNSRQRTFLPNSRRSCVFRHSKQFFVSGRCSE